MDRTCALNDELAALNERTIPNIKADPFKEENFAKGDEMMRPMVDVAPDEIRAEAFQASIKKPSDPASTARRSGRS